MSSPPANTVPPNVPPSPIPQPRPMDGRSLRRTPELLWIGAWSLVALMLAGYAFKRLFSGDLTDADTMDYAQIARNIAAGHGFATSILRPLALSGFVTPDPQAGGTVPDVSRAPLFPFALMLAFVAHGGHGGGNMVVLTSLLFFLASAAAVYSLARTVFPVEGRPWAALLSVGIYIFSGTTLGFATAGSPVPLTTFVVALFFIALFQSHETPGRPVPVLQLLGVGGLLGLCYLAQFSLLLLLFTTLAYVFATRAPSRAWAGVAMCVLGFLLVTLPWLVRTANVTHGNPFFCLLQYGLMADTSEYPGQSAIYRSVLPEQTPFAFFFTHLPELIRKAGRGLAFYQAHLLEAFPLLVLAPALASLAWRFSDLRVGILRGHVALTLFLLALVTAFFAPAAGFLAPFAPVVLVIGVGFVFELMSRQQWKSLSQRIVLWGWGILMGLGLAAALIGHRATPPGTVRAGIFMLVSPNLPAPIDDTKAHDYIAGGAVMTDTPWEVTWKTGLPAIWLPRDNQAYESLVKGAPGGTGRVAAPALLLTPNIASYGAEGGAASWIALARDPLAGRHRDLKVAAADRLPAALAARAALARRTFAALRAAHDPRVSGLTPADIDAQVAQARADLPAAIARAKAAAQAQFDTTYGPIAEVVADYRFVARQPETNGAPSTLFLRRSAVASLQSTEAQP